MPVPGTLVWQDGALLDAATARIAPDDRGFTLADGVFETVRLHRGRPCHLARHLGRLRGGAATLRFALPWDDAALRAAFLTLAAAHAPDGDGVARLTLTRGPAARGLLPPEAPRPTTVITAGSGGSPETPVRLVVATATRRNEHSPLSRIKSLNYGDGVLARLEAAERGADDALLRNGAGRLAEASAATLLLLSAGRLMTPPVADGALPGIRRALLIERAGLAEATITDAALAAAEAGFLASSAGIRPIAAIDGRTLAIRPDLADTLRRLTGRDDP